MIETFLFQSNFAYEGVNNDAVLSKTSKLSFWILEVNHVGLWCGSCNVKQNPESEGVKACPFILILHKAILVYQLQINGKMDFALL